MLSNCKQTAKKSRSKVEFRAVKLRKFFKKLTLFFTINGHWEYIKAGTHRFSMAFATVKSIGR